MSQTQVKQVVYPRTDMADNAGWMFAQAPTFDIAFTGAMRPQEHYHIKKKTIDIRLLTDQTNAASLFFGLPQYSIEMSSAFRQQAEAFISTRRAKSRPQYHDWHNDHAWIKQNIPAAGLTLGEQWPAIELQLHSFRTKKGSPVKPKQTAMRSIGPAFTTDEWPAISQLVGNWTPSPNSRKRGLDLLWNSHSRSVAALFEDVEILSGIVSQQFDSFRLRKRKGILPSQTYQDQDGWISYVEVVFNVANQFSALSQLAQDILNKKIHPYDSATHNWNDLAAWLYEYNQFSNAFYPAIDTTRHMFMAGKRAQTDVRRLDSPHDGWISYNPTLELPLWTGAFISQMNVYLSNKRKRTLDILRVEDFHDFAWLRAVLNLIDAPFGVPRAHWRHIEGAIRRRRRRR